MKINFLPNYASSISKVKRIITTFSKSPLMLDNLNKYRDADGEKKLSLIKCVKKRWNSLFYSIERFLELKVQITKATIDCNCSKSVVSLK